MADITKTIGENTYVFKEIMEGAQWAWRKEIAKNVYTMQLLKFQAVWIGKVKVKTHDGADITFEQKDLDSSEVLIRRLVDYVTRTIQIYEPLPMQFE